MVVGRWNTSALGFHVGGGVPDEKLLGEFWQVFEDPLRHRFFLRQNLLTDPHRFLIPDRAGSGNERGVSRNLEIFEDVACNGPLDDFVGIERATSGLTKGYDLAYHVLDGRHASAEALNAPDEQALLTEGLFQMLLDAGFYFRIVLNAGGLCLEHVLSLLLHRMSVSKPVEQVVVKVCHRGPPFCVFADHRRAPINAEPMFRETFATNLRDKGFTGHRTRLSSPYLLGFLMLHLTDLHRLLFGEASPWFLVEVCLRAALTYVGVVAFMRLLGPRVAGQFTLFEMSVTVVIAAAIGVPLQSADRGLLPALLLVLTLVALQRLIAEISVRRRRFQTRISGDLSLLLVDGHLRLDALRSNALSRETMYGQVRACGYLHLGQVSRIYIEPSGAFTVVPAAAEMPGLPVVPAMDRELLEFMPASGQACTACGMVLDEPETPCVVCDGLDRSTARLAPREFL